VSAVLAPAGPVAQAIADMAWVLIVGSCVVFCGVMAALAWTLLRRRDAATSSNDDRAAPLWWIVGGGLALPLCMLTALLVYTVWRTNELTPVRVPKEQVISLTAHLWWWEVRYRDPAAGIDVVLANEIHVPTGRAVTIGLASADVIHSFWVPQLAGKVDMLPGRVHQLRLQADRPGTYRGQCAEFCGEQHARMALHVVAHAPDDFERWLKAQARSASPPRGPDAQRGAQIFAQQRCTACHTVRGLGPVATIGPDLTHVGSRLQLGAGSLPMTAASLRDWIAHPQRSKPGVRMPSYERLDDDALNSLAAFLVQLQ
jgi:cytochrome c oxidase subunit 2